MLQAFQVQNKDEIKHSSEASEIQFHKAESKPVEFETF